MTPEMFLKVSSLCSTKTQQLIRTALDECCKESSEILGTSEEEEVIAAAVIGLLSGFAATYKTCLNVDVNSLYTNRVLARNCLDVFDTAHEHMVKEGFKWSFDTVVYE